MQTNSDYSHTVAILETVIEKGEEVTYRVGSKDMSKTNGILSTRMYKKSIKLTDKNSH
jgi:hypothetical protein